jgi:hypothetical protein
MRLRTVYLIPCALGLPLFPYLRERAQERGG